MSSPLRNRTWNQLVPNFEQGNATTGADGQHSSASEDSIPLLISDEDPPDGLGSSSTMDDLGAETEIEMKNKGKRKRGEPRHERGFLAGANPKKMQRLSNRITMKNISAGMKLWCVILEINTKEIVVSLPGGLRGFVLASEAVDHLPIVEDINGNFQAGQLVSCIVLQVDDDEERRLWLSLRLSLLHKEYSVRLVQIGTVLSGYVIRIEDSGYVLHFGVKAFSGFMPKYNQTELKVGQLIQGVVEKIEIPQNVLYMTNDPDVVSKSVTKDIKGMSMDHLIPGMLVDSVVQSSIENGVMLSFLRNFIGSADIFNLHETFPTSKWKDSYPPNKKVNARILFIDPSTRAVGLTLNADLVQNRPPPTLVQAGEKFDQSRVVRIDKGYGILLEIPTSPTPAPAYVCISDIPSDKVKMLEENFKEGSHVRVKVLGFRHLEGLASGTLKELGLKNAHLWKDSRIIDLDGSILLENWEKAGLTKGAQRTAYIRWVNYVLKMHKAQEIDEFTSRFGLYDTCTKSIDSWVQFAFRKKVQRLELDFTLRHNSLCDEILQNATHNGLPTFGKHSYSFPRILHQNSNLKSLRLCGITVPGEIVELILQTCPFLEHLKVCGSTDFHSITVSGPLSLKCLEITHLKRVSCIAVRDTRIMLLKVGCFEWLGESLLDVSNNPMLLELCVHGPDWYNSLFLSCQTTLERLTLLFRTYDHQMDGARLLEIPHLTKVRQLSIVVDEIHNHDFIHLLSVLGSFPNLEKLVLKALSISRSLTEAEVSAGKGKVNCRELRDSVIQAVQEAGGVIDYAEIVDQQSLEVVEEIKRPVVFCIAAWFGKVRLIDNMEVTV